MEALPTPLGSFPTLQVPTPVRWPFPLPALCCPLCSPMMVARPIKPVRNGQSHQAHVPEISYPTPHFTASSGSHHPLFQEVSRTHTSSIPRHLKSTQSPTHPL